jgi:hypothetical protein
VVAIKAEAWGRRDTRGYDPRVNRALKAGVALLGFGVLLSQLGHLLVFQLLFGSSAQTVQSTGAHAYFPALAKTSAGLAAAAFLAILLVIGASNILARGPIVKPASSPSFVRLLALLFTVQMASFGIQETLESLAANMAVASAPQILLLGAVGQLPVAILGALALKWLLVRFESAVTAIRIALSSVRISTSPVAIRTAAWPNLDHDLVLTAAAGPSLAKRGPPSSLRFSPN